MLNDIDREASIAATKRKAKEKLGRELTASEEYHIKGKVDQAIGERMVLKGWMAWLIPVLICFAILLCVVQFLETAVSFYTSWVDPYIMWMIQSHTDSVLNLLLQVYMWLIGLPLALCVLVLLILPIVTAVVMVSIALCSFHFLGNAVDNYGGWGVVILIFGIPLHLVLAIFVFAIPCYVLGISLLEYAGPVFGKLGQFHRFIKNKVFRLKKVPLALWFFVTHVLLPSILITLVVFYASDKSHLQHREDTEVNALFSNMIKPIDNFFDNYFKKK